MLTVYLDQNKWIELSKALYRADAKPIDKENADILRAAVAAGRVRFPISEIHLMEAYRIGDRERRLRLASVFATYSGGWFIASRQARVSYELSSALRRLLLPIDGSEPSFDAFSQDFFWAFGDASYLSTVMSIPADELAAISSSIGPVNALLSYVGLNDESIRRAAVVRMRTSNDELTDRIRSRRRPDSDRTGGHSFSCVLGPAFS